MPTYEYECEACKHVFTRASSIANRNIPTEESCPNCDKIEVQKRITTPPVLDPYRMGRHKTPDGFRDVLRRIRDNVPGAVISGD